MSPEEFMASQSKSTTSDESHLSPEDYMKSKGIKTPEPKTDYVTKFFGEGAPEDINIQGRLQRINRAGEAGAVIGGTGGAILGGVAGGVGAVPGAVGGAAGGYAVGAGAEVLEQVAQQAGATRGQQVLTGMFAGPTYEIGREILASSLGKLMSHKAGMIAEKILPGGINEQKPIIKGKESILGKEPTAEATTTFTPKNILEEQQKIASEKNIQPLSKDQLKASGIDVGSRQAKVSDTQRLNFYKDMSDFSSQGISPLKIVTTQKKGIPGATGKPTITTSKEIKLDPAMEAHLVDFGKASSSEIKIIKKVFEDQGSPNLALREKANRDLLNLIQHGEFVTSTSKGLMGEKALSSSTQKALKESYGDFLKKNGKEGTYDSLVDTWHREFMAEARDAIPQILKGKFKPSQKLGANSDRTFGSILKNIAEDPDAKAEFVGAVKQRLSSLNQERIDSTSMFGGGTYIKQGKVSTQKLLDELGRLRGPLTEAKVMSNAELDGLEVQIRKIPKAIASERRSAMEKLLIGRALQGGLASTYSSKTEKD